MRTHLQSRRFWLGGGVAAAVLIVLAGWLAVISPQLSSTGSLKDQTAAVQQQNAVLQAKTVALKRQDVKRGALTLSLRKAVVGLPSDSALTTFTRQIAAQAKANHVSLTSVTVGSAAATSPGATSAGSTANAAGTTMAIPITLVSSGLGAGQLGFLKDLQITGPRRALVTSTQTTPTAGTTKASISGPCTMTTQLTIFTTPLTAQAQAQLQKLLHGDISK